MNRRQFSVQNLRCPLCGEGAPFGATVCRGCQAEIVYGPTPQEKSDLRIGCFLLGLIVAIMLFTHVWWMYPVLGLIGLILSPRMDFHQDDVRYFRTFEHS